MIRLNENNIGKFNLFSTVTILVFFAIIYTTFSVYSKINDFDTLKLNAEKVFVENRKKDIKQTVRNINRLIINQNQKSLETLKTTIKERVYNAYEITQKVYEQYKGTKTKKEIIAILKEILRPIRYDNGTGYIFMASLNGIDILFPVMPQIEGSNIYQLRDLKGTHVVQQEIEIVQKFQEGYIKDYWSKPNVQDKTMIYPKRTFVKIFRPLNLYMGTGMYIDDAKKQNKEYIKDLILQLNEQSPNNYIFLAKLHASAKKENAVKIIIHPRMECGYIMDNALSAKIHKLINNSKNYLTYKFAHPDGTKGVSKTSYIVYNKEWGWIIGTGFYASDIDKELQAWDNKLNKMLQKNIVTYILILILFGILLFFILLTINKFTQTTIQAYKKRVEEKEMAFEQLNAKLEGQVQKRTLQLQESADNFKSLFDNTIEAIGLFEGGICIDVNNAGYQLFQFNTREEAIGIHLIDYIDPSYHEEIERKMETLNTEPFVVKAFKADGEIFDAMIRGYSKVIDTKLIWIVSLVDISELKNKELLLKKLNKELQDLTNIDPLTGAYNRRYFSHISKKLLPLTRREKKNLSLVMIDIDDFKKVNDTYGHDIGDMILKKLVKTISDNLRESDIVARFGGEEFVILLSNTRASEAEFILEKIRIIIQNSMFEEIRITISIGISEYTFDEDNIEEALKRADEGLYIAKENGKNKIHLV